VQALSRPQLNVARAQQRAVAGASAGASSSSALSVALPAAFSPLPVPRTTLRAWNVAMFLFHSALAAATLAVGNRSLTVPIYKTALVFSFLDEPASADADGERGWVITPEYVEQGSLPFTWLVAVFFLLSAAFHLLNATLLWGYYVRQLEACLTPTRWVEYTLSAPVMIVLISYSLGVRGRDVLLANFVLVATTMPFGYWTELVARPRSADEWQRPLRERLLPWAIGHLPQTTAWFLILLNFYDGQSGSSERAPWFVHLILWGELLLFYSFGFAALLSQVYAPRLFWRGELAFQVLSLVSKGLLGMVLLANVAMLSRFDDLYE